METPRHFIGTGDKIHAIAPEGGVKLWQPIRLGSIVGFAGSTVDAGQIYAILTRAELATEITAPGPYPVAFGTAVYVSGEDLTTVAADADDPTLIFGALSAPYSPTDEHAHVRVNPIFLTSPSEGGGGDGVPRAEYDAKVQEIDGELDDHETRIVGLEAGSGGGGGGGAPSITTFDVTSPGTTYASGYTALRDGQASYFNSFAGHFVFNRRLRGTAFSLVAGEANNASLMVEESGCYDIEFSTVIAPQPNAGGMFFAPMVTSPVENGTTVSQDYKGYQLGGITYYVPAFLDTLASGLCQHALPAVQKFYGDKGQGINSDIVYHPEATMLGDQTIFGPLGQTARRNWRWRLNLLQGDALKILGICAVENNYYIPYFGYDGGSGDPKRNAGLGTRINITRIG